MLIYQFILAFLYFLTSYMYASLELLLFPDFYIDYLEWASLVTQLVKNLHAMQETPVGLLDGEIPLEKGKATHSSILGLSWCLRQ